ncbi:MAG: protein-(glutamine-N5) methyltransferase, release factor-specific [Deltaproteobacteria bacterium RIFOXYD12_FULL_57_12]|nr:MAG: protein-(glutamine-N5) methyltransferase, release factor-specific [Deltaproteobacteria bacterium RIFOXYD12_FULL_57_12]
MRVAELYKDAVQRLQAADVSEPEIETALLLGHVLRLGRTQLLLAADLIVSQADGDSFARLLARRLQREPLAYILGEREFWSRSFLVNRDVLIPRPETELLVERALARLKGTPAARGPLLDLGTGSGIIAIVLALELPEAMVYAIDRSRAALEVACANARRHGVADRIRFVASDWLAGIGNRPFFEAVLSNPPYVPQEILRSSGPSAEALQPEVLNYEPHLALDGGTAGLETIDRLGRDIPAVLRPGGWVFMEIGAEQADVVSDMFSRPGSRFADLAVTADYAGFPRIFEARFGRADSL